MRHTEGIPGREVTNKEGMRVRGRVRTKMCRWMAAQQGGDNYHEASVLVVEVELVVQEDDEDLRHHEV